MSGIAKAVIKFLHLQKSTLKDNIRGFRGRSVKRDENGAVILQLLHFLFEVFLGENVLHIHLGVEIPQPKIVRYLLDKGIPLLSRNTLYNRVTALKLMNKLNLTSLYNIIGWFFIG